MVNTAEDARAIVQSAHFPPLGNRSFGGRRVIDLRGRDYATDTENHPLVIAQIETMEAMENIGRIGAVEGIDVLFFGPDDIKLSSSIQINTPIHSPEVAPLVRKFAASCKDCGKHSMTIAATDEALSLVLQIGIDIIVVTADVLMVAEVSAAAVDMINRARKSLPDS